jgi:hypothetical protein
MKKVMVIQPVSGNNTNFSMVDKDLVDINLYSYLKTMDNMEVWVPTDSLTHYQQNWSLT